MLTLSWLLKVNAQEAESLGTVEGEVSQAPMFRRTRSANRPEAMGPVRAGERERQNARQSVGRHAAPPRALRLAARAFRRLAGADVVWLAVRESCSQVAVIRCSQGARSRAGLGLVIERGVGVGGAVLLTGEPWRGTIAGDGTIRPSDLESSVLVREGVSHLMAIPLRVTGFWNEARIEGVAYVGARHGVAWSDETVRAGQRLGGQVARAVRDAQRVSEVTRRWGELWAQLAASGDAADHQLERMAHQIASDVRRALRSGIGVVFRLDAASGALHSLGVEWGSDASGGLLPALRRGQVLPAGCGSAGRAVALRKPFISRDYVSEVDVPPIMAEAVAALPRMTSVSVPLMVSQGVIGAVTVGRFRATPAMDYSEKDVRVAVQLARAAAPLLAQAQLTVEHARRQQGASELSRLAGSLTQSLSISAICERLVQSVLALVRGHGASVWNSRGESLLVETCSSGILRDPKDPRLGRIVDQVTRTRQAFWTPDLANDPRLAAPEGSRSMVRTDARAVLVAPVRIRESLLGLLVVTGATGRAFTDADVELVQALADQAALGIANARAYDELQVSNVQLLRHEKLVAMGRLASGLAHELRNPLQNVVGLTAELLEQLPSSLAGHPGPIDFTEYIRQAYGEAKRAADIVDRLLDYVRERTRTFETVDVREVIAEAVALVTAAAGVRGTQITVTSDDTPILVRADAIMLRQVVLNLVNNALDAVSESGTVEVRTRLERTVIGPGRVVVTVRDTGRGIPAEHLPHVFDFFFTTKKVGHGVGLGLAVCQSLIEQHGGTIRVESRGVGQGTTVEFELPAKS